MHAVHVDPLRSLLCKQAMLQVCAGLRRLYVSCCEGVRGVVAVYLDPLRSLLCKQAMLQVHAGLRGLLLRGSVSCGAVYLNSLMSLLCKQAMLRVCAGRVRCTGCLARAVAVRVRVKS